MRKNLLLFFFAVVTLLQSFGQASAVNYTFTTGVNGSFLTGIGGQVIDMSTGTTTLIGPGQTNFNSTPILLDFDLFFMGTRNSYFTVATSGLVGLNLNVTASANLAGGTGNRLAALLTGTTGNDMGTHNTGKIHYKVFGTAPNRVVVIEYLNMSIPRGSNTADATFQNRIYETTGIVEFVYGNMNVAGNISVANRIGISNASTPSLGYSTVNSSTNAITTATITSNTYTVGTIPNLHSPTEGSRRYYQFTPPAITNAPTASATAPSAGTIALNIGAPTPATGVVSYAIYQQIGGSGPFNYFANVPAAGGYNLVGLSPNTQYTYQVYAISEGSVSPSVTTSTVTTPAPATIVSAASGNWNTAATWSPAQVPTSGDNVTIANGHTVTVDPASAGGTASAGYSKSVTIDNGATIVFDNTASVTSGFLNVYGDITVNGTLNVRNGTTGGRTLSVAGNVVNGGTVDLAQAGSVLNFFGTTPQSISITGAGTFKGTDGTGSPANTGIIRQINLNNATGVSLNVPIILTAGLLTNFGNLTTNGNLTLDNTQATTGVTNATSVTVQRSQNSTGLTGSIAVGTNAVYNVTYVQGVLNPAQANITAGVELGGAPVTSGAVTVNNLSVDNTSGVTYTGGNVLVKGTLGLTGGHLTLGTGNITIGTSTAAKGSVAQTSNGLILTTGTVTRWLDASTNIVAGTTLGIFPIGVNGNQNRSLWISGQPTTGGTITVSHVDLAGASPLGTPFTENSINYDTRTNSNWVVSTGNGLAGAAFSVRARAANLPGVNNFVQLNTSLVNGVAPGTYSAGTFGNAEPEANRTTLSAANLNNTFYIAGQASVNPLPLRLLTFSGNVIGNDGKLYWTTCCEDNTLKFIVERSILNNTWTTIGEVVATGRQTNNNYSITDANLISSKYTYRLKIIDRDGSFSYSPIVVLRVAGKSNFVMLPIYPNPAKNNTNIAYQLAAAAQVQLQIVDLTGKTVLTNILGTQQTGYYNKLMNVDALASGTYIVRLAITSTTTKETILLQQKLIVE